MNKPVISASARNPKTGKFAKVRGRPVLGVTQDGVAILKPRQGATHFTTDEIRRAIARVRKPTPAE